MSSIDYTKVYLGNLRKDIQSQILKNQIYDLFRNNLNIQINRSDIKIHPKRKSDFKSAIVDCHDEHEAKHALDQFGTWKSSGQKHVHFNWDSICTESDLLTFDYKRTGAAKKNKTKIKPEKRTGADIAGKAGPSTSDNAYAQKKEHENLYPSEKVDTATTTGKGDESESQRKFYLEDEQLGNETRQKEFKEGYIPSDKKARKELLLKYLSAFLNSGEGGTLYFGVNDQGRCRNDFHNFLRGI
ncbi:uncharacterized protein LOC134274262 [Saccostrea cucullata]|uniref:uncharacterized protein LOC134274262 n=1 Tax=Saccostrea cuccullata TaxID=36930 RepID=UPI002ED3A2F3